MRSHSWHHVQNAKASESIFSFFSKQEPQNRLPVLLKCRALMAAAGSDLSQDSTAHLYIVAHSAPCAHHTTVVVRLFTIRSTVAKQEQSLFAASFRRHRV